MTWTPTCNGDKGTTSFGCTRVSKTSPGVEVVGLIDSAQSWMGMCLPYAIDLGLGDVHRDILNDMYMIMGVIHKSYPDQVDPEDMEYYTEKLDNYIGQINPPALTKFILPGVKNNTAFLARSSIRAIELRLLKIEQELDIYSGLGPYLNRLSSVAYAFTITEPPANRCNLL